MFKFIFNYVYWFVTILVWIVLLANVPVFALTFGGIILVLGVSGGVIAWVIKNRRR